MLKLKFIIVFFTISLFTVFAQRKKIPLAIGDKLPIAVGVHYERNNAFHTGYQYDKGIIANYNTSRERLGIDLLYGISKRLQTESTLGISTYWSELSIGKLFSSYYNQISIHTANLFLSQNVSFDVLYVPCTDFLKFTLSPLIGLEYEQFLPQRKHTGHSDLFSDDANHDMNVLDKPAVSAVTKIPVGILSANGGISFEMLCFNKIGILWNTGYSYSLLGRSHIDIKYRYKDNEIHTLNFKSVKTGIFGKIQLRYYF